MVALNRFWIFNFFEGSSVLVEGRIRQAKLKNETYWTEIVADTVQFLGKTKTVQSNSIETEEIEDLAF